MQQSVQSEWQIWCQIRFFLVSDSWACLVSDSRILASDSQFLVFDSRGFVSDSCILVSDSRGFWFLIRGSLVSDSRILVSDSRVLVSESLFLIRGLFQLCMHACIQVCMYGAAQR